MKRLIVVVLDEHFEDIVLGKRDEGPGDDHRDSLRTMNNLSRISNK